MPHDADHGDDAGALVRAIAPPLASAQNYLAGVQVRARSMADLPQSSDAVSEQILNGIARAILHLREVATLIEDNQREPFHRSLTRPALDTTLMFERTADLLMTQLAALARG